MSHSLLIYIVLILILERDMKEAVKNMEIEWIDGELFPP